MIGPGSGARPQSSPVRSGSRRGLHETFIASRPANSPHVVVVALPHYGPFGSMGRRSRTPESPWCGNLQTPTDTWHPTSPFIVHHGKRTKRIPMAHSSDDRPAPGHRRRAAILCVGPRKQDHDARRSRRARGGYRGRQGMGDGEPVPEYEARGAHCLVIGHMHGGRTHRAARRRRPLCRYRGGHGPPRRPVGSHRLPLRDAGRLVALGRARRHCCGRLRASRPSKPQVARTAVLRAGRYDRHVISGSPRSAIPRAARRSEPID